MRPFLLAFCLLPVLLLPVAADPAPNPPPRASSLRSDILYTHRGEFVQVKPMRPLTLNAHVEQFAYDPLGIEIAVVGSEPQGEDTVHFVKTLDARTGHEIRRFAFTEPSESQDTALMLRGWSTSGKFLMLQRFSPDPNEPQTSVSGFLRWDLSISPPMTKTIDLQAALPPEQQSADLAGSANCYPSPTGRWLVFTQSIHTQKDNGKPGPDQNVYLLYDPERDTFQTLNLPPKTVFDAWVDNSHLKIWQEGERKQFDVVTGQVSSRPADTTLDLPAASTHYPDLSLDTEQRPLIDLRDSGGQVPSCIIWIRRTAFGKTPLGAAAAGLMPSRREENNIENNDDLMNPFKNPQAIWSPTGKQVAFIANDDIYVTDLISVPGGVLKEKLAVGLSLTCAEEKALGESNLKQIGLALVQYAQDDDETYPTADAIQDKLYPFLHTNDVFQIGSHRFVYEEPTELNLTKMEAPAEIENGYMDLPCARLVLFADGHVKSFAKQETMP